jgi:hypothetical protein
VRPRRAPNYEDGLADVEADDDALVTGEG